MENDLEKTIAAQIERAYDYCKSPYLTPVDIVEINNSIANMLNALANYAMVKNDEVVDNESD